MSDPDLETVLRATLTDRAASAPAGDDLAATVTRVGTARRRRRRIAGAAAVLAVGAVAGLAGRGIVPVAGDAEPDPAATTPAEVVTVDGPITCLPVTWPAFDPALLTERPPIPPNSSLGRAVIGAPPPVPPGAAITGQTVVSDDGATAHVLVWLTDGVIAATYEYLTYEGAQPGWYAQESRPCEPERAFGDGLDPVAWSLAGPAPGPDATSIGIEVRGAVSCAGDLSAADRLADPIVEYRDDAVLIAPRVRPLPPETYDCPLNRPAEVTVQLDEPLGDRQLLDGRWYPPRPPQPGR